MTVLFKALNILFNLIELFILIRIILSYIPINMDNFFGKFIYNMTEPILSPCRELLYKLGLDMGFLDFSPLLAVLFLRVARYIIISIIF